MITYGHPTRTARPRLIGKPFVFADFKLIGALVDAIRHMHGVEARHVETVHVREEHEGAVAWEGDVETFAIDHALASRCFAWSEATTGTRRRFFAVLHFGEITSASRAVQASILADASRSPPCRTADR
jgi:hypothetical protein